MSQSAEELLKAWLGGEASRWGEYDSPVNRYITVRQLLRSIPTEKAFIAMVEQIMGLPPNPADTEKIQRIFYDKPQTSVTTTPAGKALISEGAGEYIARLKAAGYQLALPKEDRLRQYLIEVATDTAKLFDQPWSNMATRGGNYRIVNGNKYLKLLRFLDLVRADDRAELEKFYKLEGEFTGISDEAFADQYGLFRLGKVVLELYCFANLHRPDVRIYNSKVAGLSELLGEVSADDFKGLFPFFKKYSDFIAAKYPTTWLDKQQKYIDLVKTVTANEGEAKTVLAHTEQDQFAQFYHDATQPPKEKKAEGGETTAPKPTGAHNPLNLIIYGPPGTGKSFSTKAVVTAIELGVDVEELISNPGSLGAFIKDNDPVFQKVKTEGRLYPVTFHPSFAYEDFVEGIRAQTEKTQITYPPVDGVFKKACDDAIDKAPKNVYVVIDEINRGNISKIFGELITLIEDDKRSADGKDWSATLPYSREPFFVPPNLYIIGTMNTADRSIALLDVALRRRFEFLEMMPSSDLVNKEVASGVNLKALLDKLNFRIVSLGERDKQIGHSYFMPGGAVLQNIDELKRVWFTRIIPLLKEYFYSRWDDIAFVLSGKRLDESNGEMPFLTVVDSDQGILEFKTPSMVPDFPAEVKKVIG